MRNLIFILFCFLLHSCISEPKKEGADNSINFNYYVYAYANVKEFEIVQPITRIEDYKGKFTKNGICCTKIITLSREETENLKSELKKYYGHHTNYNYTSNDFKGLWDRDNVPSFRYEVDVSTINIKQSFDWDEIVRFKKENCDCDNFLINTFDE